MTHNELAYRLVATNKSAFGMSFKSKLSTNTADITIEFIKWLHPKKHNLQLFALYGFLDTMGEARKGEFGQFNVVIESIVVAVSD